MSTPLRVLSMGWGVQSFTLAVMSALGDCAPVDFAVHADTTWERAATYRFAARWTPWLAERGVHVFTKQPGVDREPAFTQADGSTGILIPAFTASEDKKVWGQSKRQCTLHWKIRVTRRVVSMALKAQGRTKRPGSVIQILGISLDEFERARDSDVAYIIHRFPLLDMRMDREACKCYLGSKGLPIPPKSSCVFCPYHNAAAWQDIRQTPEDWAVATRVDEMIRDKRPPYPLFVHPARKPLREAVELPMVEQDADGCAGAYCFF